MLITELPTINAINATYEDLLLKVKTKTRSAPATKQMRHAGIQL
ncbi:MAG: hypothetical protein ACR2I9_03895 [Candidatus Nanopelagicaceae bacterium]